MASLPARAAQHLVRDTLVRSVKTALVVGTVLALINHGQEVLAGAFSARWVIPMVVTYLVPFSVAPYGQVQGRRLRDRRRARWPQEKWQATWQRTERRPCETRVDSRHVQEKGHDSTS